MKIKRYPCLFATIIIASLIVNPVLIGPTKEAKEETNTSYTWDSQVEFQADIPDAKYEIN